MELNYYVAYTNELGFIGLCEFGTASWLNYIEIYFHDDYSIKEFERFGGGCYKNKTVEETYQEVEQSFLESHEEFKRPLGKIVHQFNLLAKMKDIPIQIMAEEITEYFTSINFTINQMDSILFHFSDTNAPDVKPTTRIITNQELHFSPFSRMYITTKAKGSFFPMEKEIQAKVMQNSKFREHFQSLGRF